MSLRTNMKAVAVAGVAAALTLTAATNAHAAKRVKWKMQNAWGATVPHLGTSAVRFVKLVSDMTEDKFQIKNFEPGALVPPLECFDAVSKGSIESCWTTPGYHAGKHPAVSFFTAVPFGPGLGEYVAWKWFGGGQELREQLYNKFGLTAMDNFCIGPETSGETAVERASAARAKDETNATAHAVEAHASRELGRFEASEAAARRAIELAPSDGESRYQLALALAARGETDGCFGELISALETDPQHLRSYVLLGLLCEKAGRKQVAQRLYEEGLAHLPENALLRARLAAI